MGRKLLTFVILALMVGVVLGTTAEARVTWYTPYQFGIHTWESGANYIFNGKAGWTVESILSSQTGVPGHWNNIRNEGFHIIGRINWSYNSTDGTIPKNSAYWGTFASQCADRVSELKEYCNIWIIGNEQNLPVEGAIPCSDYCACFVQVRNAIKAVQPDAFVLAGALSPNPWEGIDADDGNYRIYSRSDWNYFYQMVSYLANNVDGYSLHTYDPDPSSDPRYDNDYDFNAYQGYMNIIANNAYAKAKPVYITETNNGGNDTKDRYCCDWIQHAYENITNWNNSKAHDVQALCWFTYGDPTIWWGCSLANHSSYPKLDEAYWDFWWTTGNTNHWNQGPAFSSVWSLNVSGSDLNSTDWNQIKESTYRGPWSWCGDLIDWGSGGVVESGVSDNFVVWQAKEFWADSEGTYNFLTWSDDGSWLWIDGQIVVNNYGLHGPNTAYGWKTLKPGPHFLAFKMFEYGGDACAGFQWQQPGQSSYGQVPTCGALGATHVWSIDTGSSTADTHDPNQILPSSYLGSIWWNGEYSTDAPLGREDYFYIEQMRYFWAPTSGTYYFKTGSDDGSWLWVDGAVVVDNGGLHGYQEVQGSKYLTAGMHLLWFKMYEWNGGQARFYQYKKPGGNWEYIP